MTLLYLADSELDREAWHVARQGGLGASDVGAIMTSGPAGWQSLRREKRNGRTFFGNQYTRHGHEREAFIADFARRRYGLEPNTVLLARADNPTHMATPDAVTLDGLTLGEYKTTLKDWQTKDDIPRSYYWQMTWQMYVTGAQRVIFAFEAHEDFAPLYPEPRVFVFERNEEDIEVALATVAAWEAAEDEELPDHLLVLDDLSYELAQLREHREHWQAREKAKEAEIRELLEQHGKPVAYEFRAARVSWSYPKPRVTFDSAALKSADPDTYNRFTTESATSPRLNITPRS